jgi:hypothetical protein
MNGMTTSKTGRGFTIYPCCSEPQIEATVIVVHRWDHAMPDSTDFVTAAAFLRSGKGDKR